MHHSMEKQTVNIVFKKSSHYQNVNKALSVNYCLIIKLLIYQKKNTTHLTN